MEYDNPAARLHSLLHECKKIPVNTNCLSAWKKIFNTEDPAIVMSRLGIAMTMPSAAAQAILENFPKQAANCSHWKTQIQTAFIRQNLQANWDSFINNVDDHSMSYLSLSSDLLESKSTVKLIDDEKISSIRNEINDILTNILNSSLGSELKKYLARHLHKIISALDEYKLTGATLVLDAVETVIGHAYVDEKYKNFLIDDELGKRVLDNIFSMANMLTVAVSLPQLSSLLAPLLS